MEAIANDTTIRNCIVCSIKDFHHGFRKTEEFAGFTIYPWVWAPEGSAFVIDGDGHYVARIDDVSEGHSDKMFKAIEDRFWENKDL